MGNTFFYNKVKKDTSNITWSDILSESFKKHSKGELTRALVAGTSLNKGDEQNMLAKWDKPWVWVQALKFGLLCILAAYAAFFIPYYVFGMTFTAQYIVMIVIPPLVVPLIILVFIWELNIPKNVSIFECIVWWLIGGLGSLVFNALFQLLFGKLTGMSKWPAYYAPIFEEPAKLIMSIILIMYAAKNKKICTMLREL